VGAGTTGLFAGLVLARDGHQVVVVDKDARPAPIDAMTVGSWQRPGTPQAMLPHGFMARGRALLRVRAPDVLRGLLDAGAIEFALAPFMPGGTPNAEDDELVVIFCRRPLFESALWRALRRASNRSATCSRWGACRTCCVRSFKTGVPSHRA
jgi:2-polyprenyl-6-methoxyphenol hydroxylase-like FAD-dependent oxidoreductase